MSEPSHEDLRNGLSAIITGVESPVASSSSSTNVDDDLTPFPSPMLSATSLAGLSRQFSSSAPIKLIVADYRDSVF